ncbi:hypothetical protein FRC08_011543 [Ceratobasidium sp. 394]|nr:hypothetical protein FRC08_011543 [Ceratobasidium sp. 394]
MYNLTGFRALLTPTIIPSTIRNNMNTFFNIYCSASTTTSRIPIISQAYTPCGSVYYQFRFLLALVLAIAYLYLVRLFLQPPTQDASASELPRASPGRSAAVASGSPSPTPPPEEVAKNAPANGQDASSRQHESPERSSSPSKGVRNTSAQARGPDAPVFRPPSPSLSLQAPSASPRPPSPDAIQGNSQHTQRGASLPTSRHEHSRDHDVPNLALSSTNSSPLKQVLYIGSKDITQITSLDILVVPYGHQGTNKAIKDPGIDAKYLCEQFGKLDNVTVQSIPEDKVTLDRVKEAITARWEAARSGTCLLVLLSGHGDDDNAMTLPQGDRIDESHLDVLFQNLRQKHPKQLRVGIAFNICRDNRGKAAADTYSIALIWACSLGQKAWAFKFQTLHEPSSVFLLALLIAAYDTYQRLGVFEDRLKDWVSRLARFNNHVRHVDDCESCKPPSHFCPEAFVMRDGFRQDVDLEQSQGFLDDLFAFLEKREGFRELSKTVFDFIWARNSFLRSNGLILAPAVRGANEPVSQALGGQGANLSGGVIEKVFV